MAKVYGAGTYTIKLNDFSKPSLYTADGAPIDQPLFETFGDGRIVFEIVDASDLKDPLLFSEIPITWSEPDPPGNAARVENGRTLLLLDVCHPAAWKEAQVYHFKVQLSRGDLDEVLWSHDGKVIVDPTIVENPPN